MDFVPKLNTKKLGNSLSFLTNTHMPLFAKRFRSYGILTIDIAAEFCFWTEQRLNGSYFLCLGLTETLEAMNIISVGKSLIFLMVHNRAPNG
jgi:hypothetical protein